MADRQQVPSTSRPLDPTLEFLRLLWGIEHGLQRTSKRMEANIGITGPQRLVLKLVAQFPGLSARELADLVQLHPSTITGILQRLERKGLLTRETDPRDGRRVRLRVQPQARLFTSRTKGTVEEAVARVLDRMPRRQILHAQQVLRAIATSLDGSPQS
jgi:DNA-binding MarR family transcriptional regulator